MVSAKVKRPHHWELSYLVPRVSVLPPFPAGEARKQTLGTRLPLDLNKFCWSSFPYTIRSLIKS